MQPFSPDTPATFPHPIPSSILAQKLMPAVVIVLFFGIVVPAPRFEIGHTCLAGSVPIPVWGMCMQLNTSHQAAGNIRPEVI